MDFVIQNWYLIALAVVSGGMLLWLSGLGSSTGGLSVTDAILLINHGKTVIIDVRDEQSFQLGHLARSKNLPLSKLESNLTQSAKNKKTPVIFICDRGIRAQKACAIAKKLGYEHAHKLSGGLNAWIAANMPLEKKPSCDK